MKKNSTHEKQVATAIGNKERKNIIIKVNQNEI